MKVSLRVSDYEKRIHAWRELLKVGDLRVVTSNSCPHLWDENGDAHTPHSFEKGSIFMILDINKSAKDSVLLGEWEFTILTSHGILLIADGHLDFSTRELV